MEWRGQVAVVTGGARGLGRATARLLAQRGAAVLVLALALIVLAATKWAAPPPPMLRTIRLCRSPPARFTGLKTFEFVLKGRQAARKAAPACLRFRNVLALGYRTQ